MYRIFIHQNHQWMKKDYLWIEYSSDKKNSILYIIHGCYPWIKSMDEVTNKGHGWSLYEYTRKYPLHGYIPVALEIWGVNFRFSLLKLTFFILLNLKACNSRTTKHFGNKTHWEASHIATRHLRENWWILHHV